MLSSVSSQNTAAASFKLSYYNSLFNFYLIDQMKFQFPKFMKNISMLLIQQNLNNFKYLNLRFLATFCVVKVQIVSHSTQNYFVDPFLILLFAQDYKMRNSQFLIKTLLCQLFFLMNLFFHVKFLTFFQLSTKLDQSTVL